MDEPPIPLQPIEVKALVRHLYARENNYSFPAAAAEKPD